MLLSMREVLHFGPMVLDGLEALDVLCIDDVHLVAGNDAWEKAKSRDETNYNSSALYET